MPKVARKLAMQPGNKAQGKDLASETMATYEKSLASQTVEEAPEPSFRMI